MRSRRVIAVLGLACALGSACGSTGCAASAPDIGAPAAPVADAWTARRARYSYDTAEPLDARIDSTRNAATTTITHGTLRGSRGSVVPFYLIEPRNAAAGHLLPTVVVVHGKDSDIDEMVPIGLLLATRGYVAMVPEIVGHGARREAANPLFSADISRLREGLIESTNDIRRAIDYAASRPEVDKSRIGLAGFSLGAMIGSLVTALDNRVHTAVLVVGGADWKLILDNSQESFIRGKRADGPLNATQLAPLADVDPLNFVGHIAPRPLLFINGIRDRIIPHAAAQALFDAAAEPKKQLWLDAGHLIDPTLVAPPAFAWLAQNLAVNGTTR